ncbi:hypothetical protein BV22DRAFT_1051938, partial [Leucogyrophana mollusca]
VNVNEEFAGAAEIIGKGYTFLDIFDHDVHAKARKANLYYPFASRGDWKMASFLLRSGMSMAAIDEFLSLELIKQLPISFSTAKELRGRCEMLPKGPRWNCRTISSSHPTKSPLRLFWRDPVECLETLFGNPFFNGRMDFVPRRVYKTAARLVRVYSEWMTGDAAWNFQKTAPAGATILGTILSSDKTTISTMTGDRVAHPLLIGLANVHMNTHLKLSSHSFMLTALLPVAKFLHPTKRMRGVLQERLIHQCLDIVLQPLKIAASIGIMMADPAGNSRYCFTPPVAYIVDTPEACTLSCVRGKTSPFTLATYREFGDDFRHEPRTALITLQQLQSITADPSDLEAYFRACEPYRLNGVVEPFWRNYSGADPSVFFPPEPLHHWHRQFWDHDAQWCIAVVGADEIDFRFAVLQPATGYRHFKDGVSRLKQVTGKAHRDIQRYIVGVCADAAPPGVLTAIRALMDFRYLAQAPTISEDDCERIQAVLKLFHEHKQAILDAGGRRGAKKKAINNWYIPKLELMQSVVPSIRQVGSIIQWSADSTEHCHITEIKVPARNSNNNNYDPQICRYLDREEKRRRFEQATSLRGMEFHNNIIDDSYDSDNDEDTSLSPTAGADGPRAVTNYFAKATLLQKASRGSVPYPTRSFIGHSTAINLAYDPSIRQMQVDDIADKFRLPDLRGALADYIQREQRLNGGLHSVWYRVRLQQTAYHDRSRVLPAQTVNAVPPNSEWENGRYDAVLIHTDGNYEWPDSGLNGHTVVQVRLIMYPLIVSHQLRSTIPEGEVLMYVERFDVLPQSDGSQVDPPTQMHILRRARRSNGSPMGDVIPLKQIRSYINLIPRFGAAADARLTKTNAMGYSSAFYLNKYFDKEIFYAITGSTA